MINNETPHTRRFWESVGGTLMEEFKAVKSSMVQSKTVQSNRWIDGVIILGGPMRILERSEHRKQNLKGKDLIVVQTKNKRLGMTLVGQALVSRELMRAFRPRTIVSVALCKWDDAALRPVAEKYGIEVVCFGDAAS